MGADNFMFEHHLVFSSVMSEHIGSYRCQAENRGGATIDNRVILNLIGTYVRTYVCVCFSVCSLHN